MLKETKPLLKTDTKNYSITKKKKNISNWDVFGEGYKQVLEGLTKLIISLLFLLVQFFFILLQSLIPLLLQHTYKEIHITYQSSIVWGNEDKNRILFWVLFNQINLPKKRT